jgi:hypothetical protein
LVIHGASGSEGAKSGGTVVFTESASKHGSISIAGNRRLIDTACESHWEREIEGPTTIAGRPENHGPDRTWGMFAGTTIINHHAITGVSLIVCRKSLIFNSPDREPQLDSFKRCASAPQSRERAARLRVGVDTVGAIGITAVTDGR